MATRRAVPEDLPRLMAMARLEHAGSQMSHIPFDEQCAKLSFLRFIDGLGTAVFLSDNGFIMGMVQPLPFSRLWNAYEMAWFAADGSGLELLKAFTKWGKDMRAINVIVHNYAGMIPADKFNRVLKRKGFDYLGSTHSKQVGELSSLSQSHSF